jgi:D-aminopeptidase
MTAPFPPTRARDIGFAMPGVPGPHNAITDVAGVAVGYTTLIDAAAGIHTGVTAILPRPADRLLDPVWGGHFAMNGNGEMTGCHWLAEAGWFTGPIALTNTMALGMAHHGVTRWMARQFPERIGETHWPLPVVAETFDGWLNDIAGMHVGEADVLAAIDGASTRPPAEGNVGGGTGMIAYEYKGGTGTASRRVRIDGTDHTLGVLVQANHGIRPWLTVSGVPVGDALPGARLWPSERGSIIGIVATDAPLLPIQLQRLARRAGLGIGRGGTPSGNNSGDLFLAFSTANAMGTLPEPAEFAMRALSNDLLDDLFLATVQAVDEAILNAMLAATTVVGRRGRVVEAIDARRLLALTTRAA